MARIIVLADKQPNNARPSAITNLVTDATPGGGNDSQSTQVHRSMSDWQRFDWLYDKTVKIPTQEQGFIINVSDIATFQPSSHKEEISLDVSKYTTTYSTSANDGFIDKVEKNSFILLLLFDAPNIIGMPSPNRFKFTIDWTCRLYYTD